ncbi:MAG TPA: alpha/beta hydrolase domain-containing protein [Myxococcales bacterium]|nr:alpha/beta hydrolase domain-containing protein [Myxococcales bacterium]
MRLEFPQLPGGRLPSAAALAVALLTWAQPSHAKVTKIEIVSRGPSCIAQAPLPPLCSFGDVGEYEAIAGFATGELDPKDPRNAIIQDVQLAPRNSSGKVEYTASFQLLKPVNMSKASGLMWHDVPNRGGRINIVEIERRNGDIGLSSGWQGDNSGGTAQTNADGTRRTTNEWVRVPVLKGVTGTVFARIVNRSGTSSAPLMVQSNPLPYRPASLDTTKATLTARAHESMTGEVSDETIIPSTDWAWAKCNRVGTETFPPFPGTPDPTHICLKPVPGTGRANGFDGNTLYQVVFTATDPFVLGAGFAAFRDVESFFKFEAKDESGTANPLVVGNARAPAVRWSISRGVSQSGNFLRGWLHLGFNQDEARRQVSDGMWPIIAGRRIALNLRWAQPDGVLELYQAGSEGPQWWARYQDKVRGLPKRGILDRCKATHTCPKVIEHFGAAEVWELKLPIEWVGTDGKKDIPIPENVRRYYIPSTTHGGANLAAGVNPFEARLNPPNCPGNNYGTAVLPGNPIRHTETVNAIRSHFRNWVMTGRLPPASVYPTLRGPQDREDREGDDGDDDDSEGDDRGRRRHRGFLVEPTKAAMGFPDGIPGLPASVPEGATLTRFGNAVEVPFINPVLDYDWGPFFDPSDGSGIPTNFPPRIKRVIKMLVPRVDSDGNELGGVPVVLRDAPLGSYFGWNITAAGFHKDQNCDYTGGVVPFAVRTADRAATDPRPSLEERYGTHAGYVDAVRNAAANAVEKGFLLQPDADALIAQADASNVLK